MGKGGSKLADTMSTSTGEDPEINFDVAELQDLPEDFKEQIQSAFEQHKRYIEELKDNLERARVESEQKCFDLEKQLITSNGKLVTQTKDISELRQQHTELERRYDETAQRSQERQQDLLEVNERCTSLEATNKQLAADKWDLSSVINRKDKELDRLNEEWSHMSQKVSQAIKEKMDMLAQLNKVQSEEMTIKHRENRLKQEKEQLQQQHQWLDNELRSKTSEVQSLRREKSSKVLEIQAALEQKSDELAHSDITMETLKQSNLDQATKIENYIQKLKDSRDAQAQTEEQYRNEVQAQERLITLYKSSSKEAESKVGELTTAVEELQKLLKQASEAHSEVKLQRTIDIEERDDKIAQLSRELTDANDLIETLRKKGVVPLTDETVEMLAPAAAATSKLLKSGMTLTQIYSEFVQVSESLHHEKSENERLNSYLDEILEELEEKAPLMRKQREDYGKACTTVQQTTKQLDSAMVECEKLRKNAEEKTRHCGELSRENQRLKQKSTDLAQQVRLLLKELEESRGTVVSFSDNDKQVSSAEVSSSSQIISQKLVTFRSIEELQEQNQRLLEVARELSEKQEQDEQNVTDDKLGELKLQLSLAMQEIDQMKEARDKQASMVESIMRQRDMYKVLLGQSGSAMTPPSPVTPQIPSPMAGTDKKTSPAVHVTQLMPDTSFDTKALEETTKAMKELQDDFNIYRKEKAENERLQDEHLEKLRRETSDAKVQNARLASQLDFAGERYKILQGNIDGYKKEINALREKNMKLSASTIRYEETINLLRQDTMNIQEAKTLAEVRCENLKAEKNMLKSVETRLLQEKESVMREKQTQNLLLANLQAIQNNLEKSEFDTKTKLTHRIEDTEKENTLLKQKLEAVDDQNRSIIQTLDRQVREKGEDLDRKTKALLEQQTKLREAHEQLNELRSELSRSEAQFMAAENRLSNVTQAGQPSTHDELKRKEESLKDMKSQMNSQANQIKALKEQLVKTAQHMEQYKQLAATSEQTLDEHNKTSAEFQATMESKLRETTIAKEMLSREREDLSSQHQTLIDEILTLTENYQQETGELRKQLAKTQNELQELMERQEQSKQQETSATADLTVQSKLAQETQDKYERELILHAADVETLTKVKQQLDGFNQKMLAAEEESRTAKEVLQVSQNSWSEQKQALKDDHEKLASRVTDLQEQNTALHQQLHTLSEQMVTLQENQAREDHNAAELAESVVVEESQQSTEHLLQVLKFLRKEKDIAEAKLDIVQAESSRLNQQLEYANKQLQDANTNLMEERERTQTNLQTAAQHADLLRKVENLNLLQDSNRLLREDKERTVLLLRQMEARAQKLEDEIEPLQSTNRDLNVLRESLQAEKLALQKEADSWRNRTNKLIEQYNKTDPEEFKKILAERLQLKKQVATSNEEISKHKADISRLNMTLSSVRTELTSQKQQYQKISDEIQEGKKNLDVKIKDIEEKNKTLVQLRKIGRKYRLQAEENQKELEEIKAKAGQQPEQIKAAEEKVKAAEDKLKEYEVKHKAMVAQIHSLEEKVKSNEEKSLQVDEKMKSVQNELAEITEALGATNHEKNELTKRIKEEENKAKLLNDQIITHQQAANKSKETETHLKEEAAEWEKKHKALVQRVKTKLQDQKEQIDKLNVENTQLKKQKNESPKPEEADQQLKSQISQLEKELEKLRSSENMCTQLQQEVERLTRENSEMQHRMQLLQKQVENQQKPVTTPTAPKPTTERASAASTETPTANIRPMASPASQPRHLQSAPVQPVRATTAETRAMASIRPMAQAQAVSPMVTSVSSTTVTPTATVMPTTVTVAEEAAVTGHSSGQRPTLPVQPVTTLTELATQADAEETATVEDLNEAIVSQTSSTTHTTEAHPSTSQDTPTTSSKRPREDCDHLDEEEGIENEARPKRSRTLEERNVSQEVIHTAESASHDAVTTDMEDTMEDTITSATQEDGVELVEPAMELPDYPETSEQQQREDTTQAAMSTSADTAEEQDDSDDVIVLDEECEPPTYCEEMEEGQEEVIDYAEHYENEEGIEDPEDDEADEEEEEDEDINQEDDNDEDNDVIVLEDDDQPQTASQTVSQEISSSTSQSVPQSSTPSSLASSGDSLRPPTNLARVPSILERQTSMGRGQLAPFVLGSDGGFEVGDDSIVPSTPTLILPRRTDGFAEAVSSPSVHQRFIFGNQEGVLPQSGLAQLASQGALGMDDTKMDLSQFDDASTPGSLPGASPQARTTPTISVTAASPPSSTTEETDVQEQVPDQQPTSTLTQGKSAVEIAGGSSGDTAQQTTPGDRGELQLTGSLQEEESKASTSEDIEDGDHGDSQAKPRIQRIVWDKPAEPVTATVVTPAPVQTQATPIPPLLTQPQQQPSSISVLGQAPSAPAQPRRFQRGTRTRGQTGGQTRGRGNNRTVSQSPQPSAAMGRAQPPMNNSGRARGGRGMPQHPPNMGRSRGARGNRGMPFRQHQQHQQHPF